MRHVQTPDYTRSRILRAGLERLGAIAREPFPPTDWHRICSTVSAAPYLAHRICAPYLRTVSAHRICAPYLHRNGPEPGSGACPWDTGRSAGRGGPIAEAQLTTYRELPGDLAPAPGRWGGVESLLEGDGEGGLGLVADAARDLSDAGRHVRQEPFGLERHAPPHQVP